MNRITICKGQITKAYNTGKYTKEADFLPILKKYNITNGEYIVRGIRSHIENLFTKQPTLAKPKKKEYEEWYVYFYFLKDDNNPVYIGKTYDLTKRLKDHKREDKRYEKIERVQYVTFTSETDALDYEKYYTEHFQPEWNISNKGAPPSYKLPVKKISNSFPGNFDIKNFSWLDFYNSNLEKDKSIQERINAISIID